VFETLTVELDVRSTLESFSPTTRTPPIVVFETVFWAVSPVALVLPDAAVVMPAGAGVPGPRVGASATLIPDCALAALESTIVLLC
jgi:hypothetical protein